MKREIIEGVLWMTVPACYSQNLVSWLKSISRKIRNKLIEIVIDPLLPIGSAANPCAKYSRLASNKRK